MPIELITRSPDLQRLLDEGYELHISGATAIISHIPYLDSQCHLRYGSLVSPLNLRADVTAYANDHVIHFAGDYPCNTDGTPITAIRNGNTPMVVGGVACSYQFSNKPDGNYRDYYEKFTRYIQIISAPAKSVYPSESAQTYRIHPSETRSVFCYQDTNAGRAGIEEITQKFYGQKVAIVGLGGTGSYILDHVAKTPVQEIHLIDGDRFEQHNAFRAPGAPERKIFEVPKYKAVYFSELYRHMHQNIFPHACMLCEETAGLLQGMDFVFLCIDSGVARGFISQKLQELGIPFIDTGMGLSMVDDALRGTVRSTLIPAGFQQNLAESGLDFAENGDDPYTTNIQISELNALNASFAVIKWKKLYGFYLDQVPKHRDIFSVDCGGLVHED